jgi:8-oxo-dGTP pyrophosphatase MutT (NUDIX family)
MTAPAEVAPRPAATVLLLRDGPGGIEVLMVTRNVASDFASGALVFPGGRVDPADADPALLRRCRAVPGLDASALAFRVAGIRETYEEAHILLARPRGEDRLVDAAALEAIETRLCAALGRDPLFADLVAGDALELATDLLVPFAHWITPIGPPKRFDTHFLAVAAPVDQIAAHDGREAVETIWISTETALAEADARRVTLVFATRMNLVKLGRSKTVAAALDAARAETIVTVCPELVQSADGPLIRIPLAAGYGVAEVPATGIPRAWVPGMQRI